MDATYKMAISNSTYPNSLFPDDRSNILHDNRMVYNYIHGEIPKRYVQFYSWIIEVVFKSGRIRNIIDDG